MSPRFSRSCVVVAALVASACGSNEEQRPPRADVTCQGRDCLPAVFTPPGSTGAGGAAGEGGSAGSAGADSGATLTLSLHAVADPLFSTATPFLGSAELSGRAADGRTLSVTVAPLELATLSGVERASPTWLTVVPSLPEFLPTLSAADTRVADPQPLFVVAAAPLDVALLSAVPPLERAPGMAQLIVLIQDGAGAPLAGVTLEHASAEQVAYSTAGTFSSLESETDDAGVALVIGVPALDIPGETGLTVRHASGVSSVTAGVMAGAVTLLRVQI